jgi:hypothetical protein
VYLSADELLDLERARLTLLAHGIGVDRGRLVREAIALLMMDLEAGIDASMIARRLGAASRPGPAAPAPASGALASGTPGALAVAVSNGARAGTTLAGDARVGGVPADGAQATGGLAGGGLVAGASAGAQ